MPPRRATTRAAAIRVNDSEESVLTRPKRVSRTVTPAVDSDDEEATGILSDGSDSSVAKPVRKSTKKSTSKVPPKRMTSKAATTSTKARKAAKALADEDDEEEDAQNGLEEMVLSKPLSKPRGKAKPTPTTRSSRAASSKQESRATSVIDSDFDEPVDATPMLRTPRPTQKKPEPVALDEEENIVLESPTKRPPTILSPIKPAVEEEKGAKPRLVIHKIVLVNFKSYAGRQEIGPFHKA